jgi:hypothetical protein
MRSLKTLAFPFACIAALAASRSAFSSFAETGARVCVATGLDAVFILPGRRSAGWPTFWSTTRSKPICCRRR